MAKTPAMIGISIFFFIFVTMLQALCTRPFGTTLRMPVIRAVMGKPITTFYIIA